VDLNSTVNFPLTKITSKSASITGRIFIDKNHDNVQQQNESGISGFKVFLDLDGDGKRDTFEQEVTTDSHGRFSFTGLKIGTYLVRVEPKKHYKLQRSKLHVHALVSKPGDAEFGAIKLN